jgi:site-specific recombinase XerC
MSKAASVFLRQAAERGELSFSSVATLQDRFSQFVEFAKNEGIGRLERIDGELVREFGKELAEKAENGEISESYAQNLVSAVNTVMSLATKGGWTSVSATRDCGIPERSFVREEAPESLNRDIYESARAAVRAELGDRAAAIVELSRELGLRSKEASLIDAQKSYLQARETGKVTIFVGTKGGRARELTITSETQLQALKIASEAQKEGRSMISEGENWKSWREGGLRQIREIVQEKTGGGLHDLRTAYACERYQSHAGWAAPSAGGQIEDKTIDREARIVVSHELGHGRVDVVSNYVGGR